MRNFFLSVFLLLPAIAILDDATAAEPAFDRQIAPLLARRCLSCHSGNESKGKLDLSTRKSAMSGGESGKVISPGKLGESLLWDLIDSDTMPPMKP